MSSLIITCINSSSDDLELLEKKYQVLTENRIINKFKFVMHGLRNIRTFLLCARGLGSNVQLRSDDDNNNMDQSLGSLLERIEDAVCRKARKILPYCLSLEGGSPLYVSDQLWNFIDCVKIFEKEMDKWYITLVEHLQLSSSPTAEELLNITVSIMDNLVDFLDFPQVPISLSEPVESLGEMIKFMRNFIRFATLRSVENQELQFLY